MGLCFRLFHKLYENLEASAFYFSEIIYVSQYITPCTFTRSIEGGGGVCTDLQSYRVWRTSPKGSIYRALAKSATQVEKIESYYRRAGGCRALCLGRTSP